MAKRKKSKQAKNTRHTANPKPEAPKTDWITSLAQLAKETQQSPESRIRTMISCDILSGKPSIYVPPDMAELQPDSLRYLHTFARQNNLQLVEDRRRVSVQPINEKRNTVSPIIAKAISELLQQLGMPGDARNLSKPHRLSADSQHININNLIRMAAHAAPKAKRVRVQPNRRLVDVLGGDSQPIEAYGSKLTTADTRTILSHFDSPHFHAIGYSAGRQYVMHVCVAGGQLANPTLWSDFHTMTRTDFQFQLFSAPEPKQDLGLIYATFYLDLADSPAPWWLNSRVDSLLVANTLDEPTRLKHAS
ncbi:MAG: hypothetical protein AB8B87_18995 [Granulosicoccus sp.]